MATNTPDDPSIEAAAPDADTPGGDTPGARRPSPAVSRRGLLTGGLGLAVVGSLTGCSSESDGPGRPIASLAGLQVDTPIAFKYPDQEAAFLVDVGVAVEGGIGSNRSIVAYSALCQHMGCTVDYDAYRGRLRCPCHGALYDVVHGGKAVEGPSPRGLPRIQLDIVGSKIHAVGIEGGVVYGRATNRA